MRAHKAHSLISQVYEPRNLQRAWEQVRVNDGCAGVDGVTIARFNKTGSIIWTCCTGSYWRVAIGHGR